jgi:hypothetical protein
MVGRKAGADHATNVADPLARSTVCRLAELLPSIPHAATYLPAFPVEATMPKADLSEIATRLAGQHLSDLADLQFDGGEETAAFDAMFDAVRERQGNCEDLVASDNLVALQDALRETVDRAAWSKYLTIEAAVNARKSIETEAAFRLGVAVGRRFEGGAR